jgi:hypothetical protein
MPPRDIALNLLTFYFRSAFRAAGIRWNSDNNAEMTDLVDSLIAAAQPTTNPPTTYTQDEYAAIEARLVQVTEQE